MSEQQPGPGTTAENARPNARSLLVIGTLVVIAGAVLLVVWYLGRDTPAAVDTQAAVDAAGTEDTTDADETDAAAGDDDASDPDGDDTAAAAGDDDASDPDGSTDDGGQPAEDTPLPKEWGIDLAVVPYDFAAGTGTFLGFRIDEELTTVGATTAVGRTPAVEGGLTLDGTTLTAATATGDLTALTTDIPQRDSRAQRAMDTETFPTATFALTEPIELGTEPVPGETIAVEAAGELTLSGDTRPVTAAIEAVLLDGADQLLVTGTFEVLLADFGIDAPSAPIVVSVADTATIEFQLYLTPG